MEPFSISCTTCQAKLRVRNASVIGQIQTCPKCGSMVLIEAPAPIQNHSSAKDKPRAHPAEHSGLRPPPRPASPAANKPIDFADTVEDPTHYGTTKAEASAGIPEDAELSKTSASHAIPEETIDEDGAVPDFQEATTLGASSYDEMPDPDWIEDASRQRRRWIFAGGAMLAGIGLAIGGFAYLASRGSSEVVQANVPRVPGGPSTEKGTAVDQSVTSAESEPATQNNGGVDTATQQPAVAAPGKAPGVESDSPGKVAPESSNPATPEETVPASNDPAPVTIPPPPSADTVLPAAPPDITSKGNGKNEKDSSRGKADRMTPGGSLSDTLRKLGGLFDEADESSKPDPASPDPVTATPTEEPNPVPTAESPKLTRPEARNIDITARLADPIVAIEFTDTPLQDFLQFVGTLSTIPITLDPDVLVWLKLTPNSPVTVRLSGTTVAKLLETALSRMGLEAIPLDQHLLVTRKGMADETLRKTQRDVADLLGGDSAQTELLRSYVLTLIAPQSWTEKGGRGSAQIDGGSLELEQTEPVLLEVSTFLERLRVARGLPKKSSFDEEFFLPVSRSARASPQFSKTITLNYSRPTSFPKVVRRLAQEAGVSILIDWQSVAQAGWNPDAEITLNATNQPLRNTLDAMLKPMDLVYRIVDKSTFQITVPAELEARNELEFYRVDSLARDAAEAESLIERITKEVGIDPEAGGVLKYDPPSRCLMVVLSQPRQQALEKLLLEWNAGK